MTTMLWRSENAPHVTILGSIHVLDGPLPDWAMEAATAADRSVFEIKPPDKPESFRFPEMPDGRTIFSLSPRLAREVARETRKLRLNQRDIDRLYPFVALVVLSMNMLPAGVGAKLGVEQVLPRGTEPKYLETVADQCAALSAAPMVEQLRALDHFLKGRDKYVSRMRSTVAAWRRGDLQGVWESLETGKLASSCPTIFAELYLKRNERWASLAVDYIKQAAEAGESLLFVVGCGHMVSPNSFLDYLANEGYPFQQQK
jgi:uncharacterized protein YbaP (TraB family)